MGPAELDDRELGYIDLLCSALFFLLDSCFLRFLSSFFSFFLVPSSSILAHLGSSWLHLGSILAHLDPPNPPPKAFAKKEEKRHKRARAKTIDAVDFMAERQLHSGGVILASGAALHVGEDSCAALLFGLIVTFDQKNEPKSPKKRPGAKRTTNCTATLGGLRRIDSSIYLLFDKHAQTFFM